MNPFLKFLCIAGFIIQNILAIFVVMPIVFCLSIVALILVTPYVLYYSASNISMPESDMPDVRLYLNHFESLYPELMAAVAAAHNSTKGQPPGIKSWPHNTRTKTVNGGIVTIKSTNWSFSQAAGLFGRLEATRIWDRRILWEFLRDKVEHAGLVNVEQKERFGVVMEKMCTHQVSNLIFRTCSTILQTALSWPGSNGKSGELDRNMPMGMPIVLVGKDSMEWILRRGAFLVPTPAIQADLRSLKKFKLWGEFKKDEDLENGLGDYWQVIDMRVTHPWEEKQQRSVEGVRPLDA